MFFRYLLIKNKEFGLSLEKVRSSIYPMKTIIYIDYAHDFTFISNSTSDAKQLLLEKIVAEVGLHISLNKTEYVICYFKVLRKDLNQIN